MADENKDGLNTDPNADPNAGADQPVVFDAKQQEKVNQLIQDRLARQKTQLEATFNTTLEEKMTALRTELAPKDKKQPDNADVQAQLDEAKRVLADAKAREDALTQKLKLEQDTAATVKAENARILKRAAMVAAMGDQFVNTEAVIALTDNAALGITVELDQDSGQYIVREKGAIKQNASLEPMTLAEFYADYAAKNPYLAAGDTRQGANSTGNRQNASTKPHIKSKSDLKTPAAKHAYIKEHGVEAFQNLPLK